MQEKAYNFVLILVLVGVLIFMGPMIDSEYLRANDIAGIPYIFLYLAFSWILFIYCIYQVSKKYSL